MSTKRTRFLIETQGGDVAERSLKTLGDTAERASQRIETSATGGSKGLLALDAAGRGARDAMDDLAARAGPAGTALTSLGAKGTLAAAAVVAVGAGFTAASKQAISFESRLINVGKTTDLQGRDLDRLGNRIGALSEDLGLSADKLLETAAAAGQLGVKGVDNIALFTETVSKLETATDLVGEQGATQLARLLTVTDESIDSVDTLGSVIVRLGNNFAATESEITEAALRVAGTTAAFNVSSAEASAFAVTIRQVGEQSEAAATQIGGLFRSLASATDQGGAELRAFAEIMNTTADDVRRRFGEDAVGTVVDFIDALGHIPAERLEAQLERVGLAGERGNRVFGNFAKNADVLRDAMSQANDEVENATALTTEFERQLEATAKQGERLGSAIRETGRLLADPFLPAMRESADATADLVSGFNDLLRGESSAEKVLEQFNALPTALTASSSTIQGMFLAAAVAAEVFGDEVRSASTELTRLQEAHQDKLATLFDSLQLLDQNVAEMEGRVSTTTAEVAEARLTASERRIEALNARLEAFDAGGLAALERVTDQQERSAAIEEQVAKILEEENVSRERAVELATALVDKEIELNDKVEDRRDLIKELEEIGEEAAKAAEKAQERLERRQERQAEELRRRQEEQAELLAAPFINAAESIQDVWADTIFDIVREGELSFEDLGDRVFDIFARTFAEVATLRIGMPIIQGTVGAAAGFLGLPASSQQALSSALPGGAGGGGMGSLTGLGSLASSWGTLQAANVAGTAHFANMLPAGIRAPVGNALFTQGGIGGTALQGFGGTMLGGQISSMIGGSAGMGSNIGGTLGAVAGSFLPFPGGTFIGSTIGSTLGGLVGGGANNANFAVRTGAGDRGFEDRFSVNSPFGPVGLDARMTDDVGRKFSEGIARAIAQLDEQVVSLLTDAQVEAVSDALQGTGLRVDANQKISQGEIAQLFQDRFERIFGAIDAELPAAIRSAGDAQQTIEAGVAALREEAAERLQEEQQEAALEDFSRRIELAILEITDPVEAQLERFQDVAAQRLATAEQLGADLVNVERLNALQRQQIVAQIGNGSGAGAGAPNNAALERLLFDQTSTLGSTLAPGAVFENAQEAFAARLREVQAGGGDRNQLASTASNLLDVGFSRFGSSERYQSLRANVLNEIRGVVSGETVDSGVSAEAQALQEINSTQRETNTAIQQTNTTLQEVGGALLDQSSILEQIREQLRGGRLDSERLQQTLSESRAERVAEAVAAATSTIGSGIRLNVFGPGARVR